MAGSARPTAATAASWPSHIASIAEGSDQASRSTKRGSTSSVAIFSSHIQQPCARSVPLTALERGTWELVRFWPPPPSRQRAFAPPVTRRRPHHLAEG